MPNDTNQSVKNKFYGVNDLCNLFRVKPVTLWRWRKQKKIPQPVQFGTRLLWPADAVQRAIDKGFADANGGAGALSAN